MPDLTSLMRCICQSKIGLYSVCVCLFFCFLRDAFFLKTARMVVRAKFPLAKPTFHLCIYSLRQRRPRWIRRVCVHIQFINGERLSFQARGIQPKAREAVIAVYLNSLEGELSFFKRFAKHNKEKVRRPMAGIFTCWRFICCWRILRQKCVLTT
jgi:hypothetical protein